MGEADVLRGTARLTDCRLCGTPIRFVKLDSGRAMPVNPRPDVRGNVAARIAGGRLVGFVISRDKQPGVLDTFRFVPHHSTCEEIHRERKPKPVPEEGLW